LRKSTLIYDASNVDDIQSYQAPFAELHDGEWIVTRASLRNAKKFLETADLPETIRTKSQAVIQSYEAKMPVSILSDNIEVKSMWQVARFASLLSELGWLQDDVNWEAEWEADGSTVPAQLGDALVSLGNVFLAMAAEEVSELLASVNTSNADADGTTKTFCAPNASPVVKSIMAAHAKAGAKFSGETVTTIRDALAAIGTGHQSLSKMLDDTSDDTGDDSDTDKASQIAQQKRARTLKLLSLGA